ncbi:hypothetical protein [Cetobacterium sp.]|uniref:hypothetical protein n=2 Tax=Cetobacterium TaxID=180162 RepID=UPI003AEF787B
MVGRITIIPQRIGVVSINFKLTETANCKEGIMEKVFLFMRKTGIEGTNIIELDRMEAVNFVKDNYRNKDKYQIGILSGSSYDVIKSVYGEYAPFKKTENLEELKQML